jgi:uncharacterized membrane protein YjjP (DUF1212 family)
MEDTMKELEYILEFCLDLGREMLASGANLERVYQRISKICESYRLHDISIVALSSFLLISAKDEDDHYASRQLAVPATGIHLNRLRSLNQLSFTVCEELPNPRNLQMMLVSAYEVQEYPTPIVILGYLLATGGLCFIFGGKAGDAVASCIIMFLLFYILQAFGKTSINKIIQNAICTWVIASLAILFVKTGLAGQFAIVVIADVMLIIPGIPMVNAMRNLLCGNEMNAILQFMKVMLETIALVAGIVISLEMFGGLIPW